MRGRGGRLGRLFLGVALLFGTVVGPASALTADDVVTFEVPSATSTFLGDTIWTQDFSSPEAPARVELMTRLVGTDTWVVQDVPSRSLGDGQYRVDYLDSGFRLPNSRITYRFRVTPPDGPPETGPEATLLVSDDRIDWRTLQGDLVRLHWQSGSKAFAERALRIAEDSVAETSQLLGVTETEPIDFFVYADPDDFQSALGPGTKEFVAGRAVAEIRTLFGRILQDEIGSSWVPVVIGHELAHLVLDTATENPYNEPPHWMNEGLATYLSEGYSDEWRQRLANAIERDTLLPLSSLTNGFPSAREDLFLLGYAEGTSAVDFFVRTYGQEKLVELIRTYATGVTDDEAFTAATGEGWGAFESAWLADIGAAAPEPHGPVDARPGPTPSIWAAGTTQRATAGPTASIDAGGVAPGVPAGDSPTSAPSVVGAAIALVALVALLLLVVRRRRRRPVSATTFGPSTAAWSGAPSGPEQPAADLVEPAAPEASPSAGPDEP